MHITNSNTFCLCSWKVDQSSQELSLRSYLECTRPHSFRAAELRHFENTAIAEVHHAPIPAVITLYHSRVSVNHTQVSGVTVCYPLGMSHTGDPPSPAFVYLFPCSSTMQRLHPRRWPCPQCLGQPGAQPTWDGSVGPVEDP